MLYVKLLKNTSANLLIKYATYVENFLLATGLHSSLFCKIYINTTYCFSNKYFFKAISVLNFVYTF